MNVLETKMMIRLISHFFVDECQAPKYVVANE
jgi:hypothetical protein